MKSRMIIAATFIFAGNNAFAQTPFEILKNVFSTGNTRDPIIQTIKKKLEIRPYKYPKDVWVPIPVEKVDQPIDLLGIREPETIPLPELLKNNPDLIITAELELAATEEEKDQLQNIIHYQSYLKKKQLYDQILGSLIFNPKERLAILNKIFDTAFRDFKTYRSQLAAYNAFHDDLKNYNESILATIQIGEKNYTLANYEGRRSYTVKKCKYGSHPFDCNHHCKDKYTKIERNEDYTSLGLAMTMENSRELRLMRLYENPDGSIQVAWSDWNTCASFDLVPME